MHCWTNFISKRWLIAAGSVGSVLLIPLLIGAVPPLLDTPLLVTYGPAAGNEQGDPYHRQVIYFSVPEQQAGRLFVRVFDPDTSGRFDTPFPSQGDLTRFALVGGEGASRVADPGAAPAIGREAGARLAARTFGADRSTDGRWVTVADVAVADGEAVGGRRVFRFEAEGVAGRAGNVYDVAVSLRTDANEAPNDLRMSVVHPSFRIPVKGQGLALHFTLPPEAAEITIGNFDLAGGRIDLLGPFRTIPLTSSKQGSWQLDRVQVLPYERGQAAEIVVSDGEEIPNDLTIAITDDVGRQIPFELPIRVAQTTPRPVARADIRSLSCEVTSFDASASTDPGAQRLSHRWVFGMAPSTRAASSNTATTDRAPTMRASKCATPLACSATAPRSS